MSKNCKLLQRIRRTHWQARASPPTLLLLHVGEVFKREGSHRGSPEGVRLHDGLQAGPDRQKRERQIA